MVLVVAVPLWKWWTCSGPCGGMLEVDLTVWCWRRWLWLSVRCGPRSA
jgi:hypothetical protein